MHRDQPGIHTGLHVGGVLQVLARVAAEERDVVRVRALAPEAFADQHVAARFRPHLQMPADAGHAARDAARAEHDGQVERLGVGLEFGDVDVVEMQPAERAGPFGALAGGVEHQRRIVDRHHARTEPLDDPQRELRPAAAEVEHARGFLERQQVEHALDLRGRDRVAVVVVAVRDRAELLAVHARIRPSSARDASTRSARHGATHRSSAMPGSARNVHSR